MTAESRIRLHRGVGAVRRAFRRGGHELAVILRVSLPQRGTAVSPVPSSTGRSTGRTTTTAAAWFTSATPASASSGCPCGSASRITAGLGRRRSVCVSMLSDSFSPGDGQRTKSTRKARCSRAQAAYGGVARSQRVCCTSAPGVCTGES